ncbi:MAG: DJ-1/PfpI family protein [Clostridiales bacterium]|nr:DJ-1/PfpI family protein [Clostridiales bacterium]
MVYVLLGTGFEEIEAVAPVDLMRRAKIDVQIVGIGGDLITGRNGITIRADVRVEDIELEQMEMIVLPGGAGIESIGADTSALNAIKYAYDHQKYIAAICAAPTLLAKLGMLNGVNAVCYPGMEDEMPGARWAGSVKTVRDGRFVFGQAPGAAIDFGLKLIEALKGEAEARKVNNDIFYH